MKKKKAYLSPKWQKMSTEDRVKYLELDISQEVSKALRKHIPFAMIDGMRMQNEAYYEKYVKKMDDLTILPDKWEELALELVSEIRVQHLNELKRKGMYTESNE